MKNEPILRSQAIKFIDQPMDGVESHNVQLLKTGMFYHEQYGEIQITTAYLESMVKNFNDKVRGIDLAIDYAHNSDNVAAGWIESLYLQDDQLWAKVRWTKNGKQIVIDKEFRYLSAEFHNNYVNNETQVAYGPTLLGAGLTNRPFVKGMSPVLELSEKPKEGTKSMDDKDKMIADLQAQIAALKKQAEDDKAADAAGNEMADLKKQVQAYKDQAALADKAKALSEKKAKFDVLMTSGKAVEAQREHFMSGDTQKFAEAFVAPNLGGKGSSNDAPALVINVKDAAEATQKVIELAEKHLADKKVKSIGEGQALALRENPELSKKIYG